MRKRSSESALLVLFVLSFLETSESQVITGNILGTVKDETGAVPPGALATIRSPALLGGPATFVTNEKGQYRSPALAPGLYGLTVPRRNAGVPEARGLLKKAFRGRSLERNGRP